MSMLSRLNYLFNEGFEVNSVMGYDATEGGAKGDASILYRIEEPSGKWRVMKENFEVTYDEMQACSQLFLQRLRG